MSVAEPMGSVEGADRVQNIRAGMTEDAEAGATFAEALRIRIVELNDRVAAETGGGGLGECAALIGHARDRVAGLDPGRLEPRGGLAGLFDGRGKRLKAFRAAYASVAEAVAATSADLTERADAIERRGAALETLWSETREAVADLDDHIAAGRAWLADRAAPLPDPVTPDPVPPEAAAAFEDAPVVVDEAPRDGLVEAQADSEAAEPDPQADVGRVSQAVAEPPPPSEPELTAAVTALPHPLEGRLQALVALRAIAVSRLPLIRAAQNAGCAAPAALRNASDQTEAWRLDWREVLGLGGKRPRKVHPDGARLLASRRALETALTAAERKVAADQARLDELASRVRPAPLPSAAA